MQCACHVRCPLPSPPLQVLPNKFPAVWPGCERPPAPASLVHRVMPAHGFHEVVVESPLHNQPTAQQSEVPKPRTRQLHTHVH